MCVFVALRYPTAPLGIVDNHLAGLTLLSALLIGLLGGRQRVILLLALKHTHNGICNRVTLTSP